VPFLEIKKVLEKDEFLAPCGVSPESQTSSSRIVGLVREFLSAVSGGSTAPRVFPRYASTIAPRTKPVIREEDAHGYQTRLVARESQLFREPVPSPIRHNSPPSARRQLDESDQGNSPAPFR